MRVLRTLGNVQVGDELSFLSLVNAEPVTKAEVLLDYGRCEGGFPIFAITSASAPKGQRQVSFQVTYSETIDGIEHEKGMLNLVVRLT
jgi:hypothetical protein